MKPSPLHGLFFTKNTNLNKNNMASKTTSLPGFSMSGFKKALENLSRSYANTVSNAKARSQGEPSINKGGTSRPTGGQSGLTDEEWNTYYGQGV